MGERVILYLSIFVCMLACTRACNPAFCNSGAVNCKWGDWGDWGPCSGYRQSRERSIVTFGRCGGTPCAGSSSESKTCSAADAKCTSAGGECQFSILPCEGGRVDSAIKCGLTMQQCCIKNGDKLTYTVDIMKLTPTGASQKTADSDYLGYSGVPASRKMMDTDFSEINKRMSCFVAAGEKHDIHPAVLAAIASRESRGGTQLKTHPTLRTFGWGDCTSTTCHGYGIMQCDVTTSSLGEECKKYNWDSCEHVELLTREILVKALACVQKKHPTWKPEQQLQGAVAAYNFGCDDVQTWGGLDQGTTKNDYSNDVMARAQWLVEHYKCDGRGASSKTTYCQSASAPPPAATQAPNFADQPCVSRGGTCQEDSLQCGGEYSSGLCGGSVSRRCCLPKAPQPAVTQAPNAEVPPPAATQAPDDTVTASLPQGEGNSDIFDQPCESRGGTCQEDSLPCGGEYSSSLCAGSSSRRCCLPNAMSNDGACHDHGGVCTEASGCTDEQQSGFCGDHADTSIIRKCCIPARKNHGSACFARMCSTHANNEARQCDIDGYGCGYYKASRGSGTHSGVDIKCAADATVYAPFAGSMVRLAAPYTSGKACCNKGILIRGNDKFNGWEAKIFYVTPTVAVGASFTKGQAIATHVSLHCPDCYKTTMTDHVHIALYKPSSTVRTDPTPYVYCTTPGK